MIVTTLKPDIVIIDENKKKAVIYELTVPFENNIHTQHKYKSEKHAYFETDIKQYDTTVVSFEVGARGFFTGVSKLRLNNIHKQFIKKPIKCKTVSANIQSLVTLLSNYTFTARKQMTYF